MSGGSSSSSERVQPKIIVVGAGIAGIAAAEYLKRHGFTDVLILEASNRTGGRIWSVSDSNGRTSEMGAYWIHGIEKNPIYQIADQNQLLQLKNENKTLRHKKVFLTESGAPLNGDVVNRVDLAFGQCMADCESFYKDSLPLPEELESVGEYVDQERTRLLEKLPEEKQKSHSLLYDQRILAECIINGCNTLHDLALSEIGSYEELPGIHYTIPPGFEKVLDILKKNIPKERILLNHPVKCIHWDKPDNHNGNNNTYNVCVECENGQTFYVDHVIVTVSLGVLKAAYSRMFNPKLSTDKIRAIESMGFGIVDKVILEFSEPIIDLDICHIELLWDKDNVRSNQDLSETWYRKISSFEVMHDHFLLGWLCGTEALYMESMSEEDIAKDCTKILQTFLRNPDIPVPKRVIRTRWGNNPYTRGSYSFIQSGSHTDDIITLQKPLLKAGTAEPVVLFAGEATHEAFFSTTHGGLLTGWREAERITNLYSQ